MNYYNKNIVFDLYIKKISILDKFNMATNISWNDKVTNTLLYTGMPNIFEVLQQLRLKLAVHCVRNTDELTHNLIYWKKRTAYEREGDNPWHSLTS